ncbi:MAG: Rnase Y domain-containing protein [Candidatus Doudnabacteria bacterium]|nr:Rnase Y domain-containing protein [Candidatus Doudnabacteria bacterium]
MILIYFLIGLVAGAGLGYFVRQQIGAKRVGTAEGRAEKIIEEAHRKEKEMLLEARSKAIELIDQAKKQEGEFRSQIVQGSQGRNVKFA